MKIAFFSDFFFPQVNGVVSYVDETASALLGRGHEVVVFAPQTKKEIKLKASAFPYQVIFLPSLPLPLYPELRISLPSFPFVFSFLKKFKPQVIHLQAPYSVSMEGLLNGKILKIPLVGTNHGFIFDPPFLEDFKLEKFSSLLYKPLSQFYASFYNLLDGVVCPTFEAKEELLLHGLKKPAEVIFHGLDLGKIEKIRKRFGENFLLRKRKELGIEAEDKVGIFVGRLAADKSIEVLIQAWRFVMEKIPQSKLLLVGFGPQEEKLKKLVAKLNLAKQVIFLGRKTRQEIFEEGILQIADIAVSASKIENPSYSLLESMAFALPIVGVLSRGVPEIVDKKNGILVPPDNPRAFSQAVISLFLNSQKIKELKKGALEKVKKFHIQRTILNLENFYLRLIDNLGKIGKRTA